MTKIPVQDLQEVGEHIFPDWVWGGTVQVLCVRPGCSDWEEYNFFTLEATGAMLVFIALKTLGPDLPGFWWRALEALKREDWEGLILLTLEVIRSNEPETPEKPETN